MNYSKHELNNLFGSLLPYSEHQNKKSH